MTTIYYIANIRLPTEKAHGMQIMRSCEAFARAGASVELLVPRRRNPMEADPFEYYKVERNFTIKTLSAFDTVRFGRLGFLVELASFLLSARTYLRGKKGMIYTREEGVGVFFGRFALELHSLPERAGSFRRHIWRRARALVVLTSFIKRGLENAGADPKRIIIAPDAVDLAQFDLVVTKSQAREQTGLPQDKKIVLYAGSFFLYDWKGVDTLLESAKSFDDNTLFVLAGGSEREVNEATSKWGRENVMFLGYRPPTSIPLYLKSADVLVIPNKKGSTVSEQYTSPLKLFEYLAAGRPIVASRLPSLEEAVGESEVVFFEPSSREDLARSLRLVLGDEALVARLSKAARRKADDFTWTKRMAAVLRFCRGLY